MSTVIEQTEVVLQAANLVPLDLAALIDQHQADVWRYLRYLGAEAADADDLTQETFLAVSRSKFEQRSPAETAGYLRTAARNQLLMLRRKQGRQIDTVELEAAEQVWAESTGDTGMGALLETLADCLKTVDGRAREAIHLGVISLRRKFSGVLCVSFLALAVSSVLPRVVPLRNSARDVRKAG